MGAEHLVVGLLLIDGVLAYLAHAGQSHYDVVAVDPDRGTSCRLQVKSRWATDANSNFPISMFDSDFVVFARLNRGVRYRKLRAAEESRRPPEFWVVPTALVRSIHRTGRMSVARLIDIPDRDSYRDNWGQVREVLERS